MKSSPIGDKNSLIRLRDNYANYTYHNHEFTIPQKTHNNRNFQMINDLQRRFENADNFLLVQGWMLIMAFLTRLQVHRLAYVNLTETIVARHAQGKV